jgi:hypothetical protein
MNAMIDRGGQGWGMAVLDRRREIQVMLWVRRIQD